MCSAVINCTHDIQGLKCTGNFFPLKLDSKYCLVTQFCPTLLPVPPYRMTMGIVLQPGTVPASEWVSGNSFLD